MKRWGGKVSKKRSLFGLESTSTVPTARASVGNHSSSNLPKKRQTKNKANTHASSSLPHFVDLVIRFPLPPRSKPPPPETKWSVCHIPQNFCPVRLTALESLVGAGSGHIPKSPAVHTRAINFTVAAPLQKTTHFFGRNENATWTKRRREGKDQYFSRRNRSTTKALPWFCL